MVKKILVADDDQALLKIYQEILENKGYEVSLASDGQKALTLIAQESPDLVLLDLAMPLVSGFHLMDIVRSSPEIESTRFLVISARADDDSKKKALDLGAVDYLVKSETNNQEILERISSILS